MIILGLTGSIGMGKSEASKAFRRLGVPVFDADAAVHELMGPGGAAVREVEAAFPGSVRDGAVDRVSLGPMVFGKPEELRRLEAILHPRVGEMQRRFLMRNAAARRPLVVLDIPLLFEGKAGEERCDVTAVVSAPAALQRHRVLSRPNMTVEKFENILKQQVPDRIKRERADFILPTGLGKAFTFDCIRRLVDICVPMQGRVWPPRRFKPRRPLGHPSRKPIVRRYRNARNRS